MMQSHKFNYVSSIWREQIKFSLRTDTFFSKNQIDIQMKWFLHDSSNLSQLVNYVPNLSEIMLNPNDTMIHHVCVKLALVTN